MRLGPYELGPEIGRGARGVVFRATAPDGRAVAVKACATRDREALARFRREIEIQRSLDTKGFVPFVDAGEDPRGAWLVMPLLEGGTLRARMRAQPLAVGDAVGLVRTLARTMGAAHRKGVVHRDLKPENVLFDGQGRPFIADLGLAKHFEGDTGASLSKTGWARGTFGYAAPEQLSDAKSVGPPADVFALGAILYECLSGRAPFEGDSALDIAARAASGSVTALRELRAEVPPAVERIVARALAPRPDARFADADALASALDEALVPERPRSRSRTPLVAAIAGVALALLAVAVAVVVAIPRATPAPPAPTTVGPAGQALVLERSWGRAASLAWASRTTFVTAIAASPDGRSFATGDHYGRVLLWNGDTGELVRVLADGAAHVSDVAFSADGKSVTYLRGWPSEPVRMGTCRVDAAVVASETALGLGPERAISADGAIVALAREGEIVLLARGTKIRIPLPGGATHGLAVASDASLLVASAEDALLAVTTGSKEVKATPLDPDGFQPFLHAVASDGAFVAALYGQGPQRRLVVFKRDVSLGGVSRPTLDGAATLALSADGRFAAVGAAGAVEVFDLGRATSKRYRVAEPRSIVQPAIGGGRVFLAGSWGAIERLDAATGQHEAGLVADPARWPLILSIAPDGKDALVATREQLTLHDLVAGAERWRASVPTPPSGDPPHHVDAVIAADGRCLAATSDGTLVAFDRATGERRRSSTRIARPGDRVDQLAFAPDGKHAAAVVEGDLVVLPLDGGAPLGTWKGEGQDDLGIGLSFVDPLHLVVAGDQNGIEELDLGARPVARRNVAPASPSDSAPNVVRASRGGQHLVGLRDGNAKPLSRYALRGAARAPLDLPGGFHGLDAVVFSDGSVLASSVDGALRLFAPSGVEKVRLVLPGDDPALALALLPDESGVVAACSSGRMHRIKVTR